MATQKIVVRHAIPADERALFDILIDLHRHGIQRLFPYDFGKVVAMIEGATKQRGIIIGLVDAPDRDNYIAGMIRLSLEEWEWSRCAFIVMRQLYVREEYRKGTRYADALMKFGEEIREHFQEEVDYPVVLESSYVQEDPRRLGVQDRFWGRWGRRVGSIFVSGL